MDVEVFLGNLQDENFDYKKGNYNSNIPKPISKGFLKSHKGFTITLQKIHNK